MTGSLQSLTRYPTPSFRAAGLLIHPACVAGSKSAKSVRLIILLVLLLLSIRVLLHQAEDSGTVWGGVGVGVKGFCHYFGTVFFLESVLNGPGRIRKECLNRYMTVAWMA